MEWDYEALANTYTISNPVRNNEHQINVTWHNSPIGETEFLADSQDTATTYGPEIYALAEHMLDTPSE